MPADADRALAALRALDRASGGRRVAWTEPWAEARAALRREADSLPGVTTRLDEAGNLWAVLPGRSGEVVALGSHLDCVPDGGWLDGCLGVLAGLEVLRSLAAGGQPPRTVALVDWADEEGARFGHSLIGSSAAAGLLDPGAISGLRDATGTTLREALAGHGVEVERMPEARHGIEPVVAYLELHIEQGPVLEREGRALAAVDGCRGVRRSALGFAGVAAHAGTTPLALRRDPVVAAARAIVAIADAARSRGGLATVGAIHASPGTATAVAERCSLTLDLRHGDLDTLDGLDDAAAGAAAAAAQGEGCSLAAERTWAIDPVRFDAGLVAAAARACGGGAPLTSGALHDAAALARAGVPVAMVFVRSCGGVSHSREEDSTPADVAAGVAALEALAREVVAGGAGGPAGGDMLAR